MQETLLHTTDIAKVCSDFNKTMSKEATEGRRGELVLDRCSELTVNQCPVRFISSDLVIHLSLIQYYMLTITQNGNTIVHM